jgi:ribosomal protein S7
VKQKHNYYQYLPHSAARYNIKRFRKAQCPIVERLVNALMMHGRNNGKKTLAVRIVQHAFEIIHLLTDKNPLTLDLVKILPELVLLVPFEDKLLMFLPFDE